MRDGIADGTVSHLTDTDLPPSPPSLPPYHVLAPDRIMQVDMKLHNQLLTLITSKGRRRHYSEATTSGCKLLTIFMTDAKAAVSKYVQSPHVRKLEAQLAEVKQLKLTQISMTEFDEVRDSLEELKQRSARSGRPHD